MRVGDGEYGVEEVVGDGRSYYGHIIDSPVKTRSFTILFPPCIRVPRHHQYGRNRDGWLWATARPPTHLYG
jgi:hypothetical protein